MTSRKQLLVYRAFSDRRG